MARPRCGGVMQAGRACGSAQLCSNLCVACLLPIDSAHGPSEQGALCSTITASLPEVLCALCILASRLAVQA